MKRVHRRDERWHTEGVTTGALQKHGEIEDRKILSGECWQLAACFLQQENH